MDAKEKILKAADQLFGEVGFDATSTREIAELSGVNKALIHYHFKSKDALLESILDLYYEKLTDTLREALQVEGSLMERMSNLIDTYVDFLNKNQNFARTIQREVSGGKHVDLIRVHMVPLFQLGTDLLQEAYPQTRSGDLAASQLLISFFGMIMNYFSYSKVVEHLLGTDPLSKKELEKRKRHLRRMLEIVEKEISNEKEPAQKRKSTKKAALGVGGPQ